jgi:hypothetical protein
MDANAHVGLSYDRNAKGWFPTESEHIGKEQPEQENKMGAVFHQFLRDVGMVALNTFEKSGKTFHSQSSDAQTRIDFACVPLEAWKAKRFSPPYVDHELGDLAQYVISKLRLDHAPLAFRAFLELEFVTKK